MNDIVTFIVKDIGRSTYGAVAYCGNECLWFSGDGFTYDEAQKKLEDWKDKYNWGVKA